ncbi:hypothetical protein [Flavobacterium aurantiibacter]|nr:hypothetical protein [Flavobacterium aurantiibacter]
MKIIFNSILIILLSLSIHSCRDNIDKVKTAEKVANTELSTAARRPNMWDRYILFEYKDTTEVSQKLPVALHDVSIAQKSEIENNTVPNAVRMSSTIEIGKGQALYKEFKYFDSNDRLLLWYTFDTRTGYYIDITPTTSQIPPLGCPPGSSRVGVCNYGSGLAACIADVSVKHIVTELAKGRSVTVTTNNTLLGVEVCATGTVQP